MRVVKIYLDDIFRSVRAFFGAAIAPVAVRSSFQTPRAEGEIQGPPLVFESRGRPFRSPSPFPRFTIPR